MADSLQKELLESLAGFKQDSKYADFTIRCGPREWRTHRIIICSRSRYFEKACEDTFKEGKQGEITLEEDDPDIVDRMIEFLYRLDYDDQPSSECLTINALVYAMAEKYAILSLKELAKKKMGEAMKKRDWGLETLVAALSVVWSTTPQSDRGLRDQLTPLIQEFKSNLAAGNVFFEAIRNNGDLAVDIVRALISKPGEASGEHFYCNFCEDRVLTDVCCADCGRRA